MKIWLDCRYSKSDWQAFGYRRWRDILIDFCQSTIYLTNFIASANKHYTLWQNNGSYRERFLIWEFGPRHPAKSITQDKNLPSAKLYHRTLPLPSRLLSSFLSTWYIILARAINLQPILIIHLNKLINPKYYPRHHQNPCSRTDDFCLTFEPNLPLYLPKTPNTTLSTKNPSYIPIWYRGDGMNVSGTCNYKATPLPKILR